jgi:hypothetical protein
VSALFHPLALIVPTKQLLPDTSAHQSKQQQQLLNPVSPYTVSTVRTSRGALADMLMHNKKNNAKPN